MERFIKEGRWAIRAVLRQPLLALVIVATLALGIGASTAIFSVMYAVLIRPLPYQSPRALVTLWMDLTRVDGPSDEWASWDNFNDWRRLSDSFESMTAISGWRPTLAGGRGALPEQLRGGAATADVFSVLGRHAALGRGFSAEEDRPQAESVVMLGHGFFERRFGGDDAVLETLVELDSEFVRVIGVLPEDFELPFLGEVDALRPMRIDASNSCGRGCVVMRVVGRLASGASLGQAEGEMRAIAAQLEEEFPASNTGVGVRLIPLHERVTGQARAPLLILLAAAALVLATACANVASVQLARAIARRGELALRFALGASRWQLTRQLLTETLVLATLGGVVGIALGFVGVGALGRLAAGAAPRLADAAIDGPALTFAVAATLLTTVMVGLVPALRAAQFDLRSTMQAREDAPTAHRMRGGLVIGEVALAVVLLVGTGLLGRSLVELFRIDLGFRSDNALVARVALSTERYQSVESRVALAEAVRERMLAVPGVRAAGFTTAPPLAGNDGDSDVEIEGRPLSEAGRAPVLWVRAIDPDYFRTLGIAVRAGRPFDARDRLGAADVVVLNEAAARRYWPEGDAVGGRVNFNRVARWREVVGIVADTRHFGLTEPARPAAYLPYAQSPAGSPYFIVRTDRRPLGATPELRAAVAELDPALAVAEATTLDAIVGNASATERLLVGLLALFSATSVLLAALGLYGVMSHVALQRRREMRVRLAVGARPGQVGGLLVRQGLGLATAGVGLGLLAAMGASRGLRGLLYQVDASDPVTWSTVPALVLLVALLATWVPARRASSMEITDTLRRS